MHRARGTRRDRIQKAELTGIVEFVSHQTKTRRR